MERKKVEYMWVRCPNCGSEDIYPLGMEEDEEGKIWYYCFTCKNKFRC
jgi:DNA-directed RNA polymerase subunit RPC12/RpoP